MTLEQISGRLRVFVCLRHDDGVTQLLFVNGADGSEGRELTLRVESERDSVDAE